MNSPNESVTHVYHEYKNITRLFFVSCSSYKYQKDYLISPKLFIQLSSIFLVWAANNTQNMTIFFLDALLQIFPLGFAGKYFS